MKPPLSNLFNIKPGWLGVCRATLVLSLAWPVWAAASFTVNGNGTVTDTTTSLVWDQCILGRTGSDCLTDTAAPRLYTWPEALAAAVAANAASYKGFTDWRVPNVNELESITKNDTYTSGVPAIDTTAFPNTLFTSGTWTSTTQASIPSSAVAVDFDRAFTGATSKTSTFYVRLVRSGQPLASFDLLRPPVTTVGPTLSSGPTQTTAGISVTIDETGTGYWLVVPSAAAAPTPAQVVAGVNYGGVTLVDAGSTLMGADTPAGISLSGLTAATAYTLYFVAKDTANNLQAAVSSVAVSTAALIGQTITGFNPASPVVFGTAPVTLSATGGASGQPVVFATTSASTICTVSGTTVTFTGVGVCNLSANQAGGGSYAAATQATASITTNAASQTITGFNPASPVVFGAAPVTLSATGGASGQPVLFATTSAGTICTVSGNTVTFTGVGVCNLSANQAGAGSYAAAPQVSASITVNASRSVSGSSPAGGSITAAFSGGNASCSYASSTFTSASAPPGITLLHGAFGFTTTDCGAGASLGFTITYPQTLPVGTRVYKYGPTTADASDHWHVLSHPSVSISGNRLTFTVTDNDKDSGDSNPAVGFITDPVGVGVPALGSDATSIPTLSEWGAILLSGLLGLLGLARVRRQNS